MPLTVVIVLVAAFLVAGCADDSDPAGDAGAPQHGGRVVYGLEAETTGGWCLPASALAISGIQVARSIYDTLTVPDSDGGFRPFLAESVEPNDDFTEWTITLREGITFHDESEFDAEVVKNFLDAGRGLNEEIPSPYGPFVLQDITDITVEDELTLKVTTNRPWVSLPEYLYAGGRGGIMAQAQLDDPESCATNLIGTGPFKLVDWQVNDRMRLERNEDYWRTDEEGNALPYLDELEYRPIPDETTRVSSLQGGEIDAFHSAAPSIIGQLRDEHSDDAINLVESDDFPAVGMYAMLNAARPPFDDPIAREAAARALDREQMNEVLADGIPELANGPFAPGTVGYLDDTGYPTYDPERARELVDQYEEETGSRMEFELASSPSPGLIRTAEMMKELFEDVGMEVSTSQFEQSAFIQRAFEGAYQAQPWRLFPGVDPDGLYVLTYGGSPVNFMFFDDPEVNRLLDEGRVTADPEERREIYQALNRRLNEQVYALWSTWILWAVPSSTDVHGVVGARPVETDGSEDFTGLTTGHDPALLWREQ